MRVNPNFTADLSGYIDQAQQSVNNETEELSTGRRVNLPSDDPAAEAEMIEENAQLSSIDDYTSSSNTLTQSLNTADSTLSSAVTAMQRALTLATEAGNSTMNPSDLSSILSEVQGIQAQMISLANTSFAGEYLFGGTATGSPPYVVDAANPDQVDYVGNDQQNSVQVGTGLSVKANLPGSSIFSQSSGSVFGALQSLISALQSGDTTAIQSASTQIGTALNALDTARVFYGNTVNQLTDNENFLNQEKLNVTSEENSLVSADTATVATELSQSQTTLQATVEAAAQVDQEANLLNYLH
jgi:flagellar hook-associated protein 3 FlgL